MVSLLTKNSPVSPWCWPLTIAYWERRWTHGQAQELHNALPTKHEQLAQGVPQMISHHPLFSKHDNISCSPLGNDCCNLQPGCISPWAEHAKARHLNTSTTLHTTMRRKGLPSKIALGYQTYCGGWGLKKQLTLRQKIELQTPSRRPLLFFFLQLSKHTVDFALSDDPRLKFPPQD